MRRSELCAMSRTVLTLVVLAVCVWGVAPVLADDWPQWRGAGRFGVWHETGIIDEFPESGLKVTWRVPINSGFSGPVVADGRVYVSDWQEDPESRTMDGAERLLVLGEETGEVLWTREWPTTYRMLMASYAVGPRATPTVDGDRVYVVGASGMLLCLDVETGEVVWQKDYIADYDTSVPTWRIARHQHRFHRLARAVAEQPLYIPPQRQLLGAMPEARLERVEPPHQPAQLTHHGATLVHRRGAYRTQRKVQYPQNRSLARIFGFGVK